MTHLDEELLAQWALEGTAPDADAAAHLSTCPDCQATLADLRELAADAAGAPDLATPPPALWDRIASELHLSTGPAVDPTTSPAPPTAVTSEPTTPPTEPPGPTAEPTASTAPPAGAESAAPAGPTDTTPEPTASTSAPTGRQSAAPAGPTDTTPEPTAPARRAYGRGTLALAASVAAVLGIGIGLGAAAVLGQDEEPTPPPVAVVRLEPLPGKSGGGTADLIQAGNELKVSVSGLDAQNGFYELWLINADGERMVSLGVLDPTQGGTFRIPDNLTSEGYRIVDVSLEPNDGNPAHSRDSIVRGTLPA
ncbi:anti-sigma factor domain-containing protein [Kribbella sp. NPDC002412]